MFTRTQLFTAGFAALVLLAPVTSRAQSYVKASSNAALSQALVLHDSAVALYTDPARAADAARIHIREAALRDASDPEAVEALLMAGRLFYYAKRPLDARKTMEKAAERAVAIGDVAHAAHAYLDAASLSFGADRTRLARKAEKLAASPLLSAAQRGAILNRISTANELFAR